MKKTDSNDSFYYIHSCSENTGKKLKDRIYFPYETRIIFQNLYYKLEKIIDFKIDIKIIVLPDFFLDRVIQILDMDYFIDILENKIKVGGGSVRGFHTSEIKGGNAVNVAYCLAKLGVKVDLFTVADKVGSSILYSIFQKFEANVNLHIENGKHGLSTIFEFRNFPFSISNVMVSDVGDNDNFGPGLIDCKNVLSILNSANAVVLTNWASNLRGTDLLKYIFSSSPNSVHFLDPADIKERRFEFINDLKNNSNLIDFLSINENEYLQLIDALLKIYPDIFMHDMTDISSITPENLCYYATFLSNFFKIDICVHTMMGSVLSNGIDAVFVNSVRPSIINIVSGAGDSWDSAFLFGHLLGFSNEEKLCFANLFASIYIENIYHDSPSLRDVIFYIRDHFF